MGIRPHHLALAERWFNRHGLAAVFFGRMLPVVRTYISFPAGLARVQPVWFAVLTFVGALPWNAGLAYVGYLLRDNFDRITVFIADGGYLFAVAVAALVFWWWWRGRREDQEPA